MTDCNRSIGTMAANDPNNPDLCVITDFAYEGLHTLTNGVLTEGPYAGEEIGLCSNLTEGLGGSRFIEIPGVTFSTDAIARLREMFNVGDYNGVSGAGTDRVILCAGASRPGVVGIDIGQQGVARTAIETLMSGGWFRNHGEACLDLFPDDPNAHDHCSTLVDSLVRSYNHSYAGDSAVDPLETPWETAWYWLRNGLLGSLAMLGTFLVFGPMIHRYNARSSGAEAVREARFEAARARRLASERNAPEGVRRQAEIAEEAAREAETARRDGRPNAARRHAERARAAADEAERIARSRRGGGDDGEGPGDGPSTPVAGGPVAPVRTPVPNPGGTSRVALPDGAAGILAFHGMSVMPSADGVSPVFSTDGPMSVPGVLPVPMIPAPMGGIRPVVGARPVVLARPILAVP